MLTTGSPRGAMTGPSSSSRTEACSSWLFPFTPRLCLMLVVLLLIATNATPVAGSCASCLNGGQLLMPNNIFSFCRCKCPPGKTGPRCQFSGKKKRGSSKSLSPLSLGWSSQLLSEGDSAAASGRVDKADLLMSDQALLEALWESLYQLDNDDVSMQQRRRR